MSHTDGGMEEIEEDILRHMLQALFGETYVYIGQAVEKMPERRRANIVRICKIALGLLGTEVVEPGGIPPRVANCLLSDGSYVEDAVASQYWGGVLACARTANPRDDRAARKLKTLGRLGSYDIRTHYLFYTTLRLLLRNSRDPETVNFDDEKERFRLAAFIPAGYYILAMDYNKDEIVHMPRILSDILVALGMEYLVDGSNTGADYYLKQFFTSQVIRGEGIVFSPGLQGIQLFLWAFGYKDKPHNFFLDPELRCRIDGLQMGIDQAGLVYEP